MKPENFLLADKSEEAPLKATDFGLSVFYKPGQVFTDIVGSAYYVAPEVGDFVGTGSGGCLRFLWDGLLFSPSGKLDLGFL